MMPVFAFLGRLVAEKGVSVLIEASAILVRGGHQFELRIIGGGPEEERLRQLVSDRQLTNVSFTSFLQGPELEAALADVVAVIMPSIWEETAGLVAIENMLAGRLVIASNIGGLAEIVGRAGLLCTPGDPVHLADRMLLAMQDPSIGSALGFYAQLRARELFSMDRMLDEHLKLFRKAVE